MKEPIKTATLLIANAIIWAALVVVTRSHLKDPGAFGEMSHYFLAGWFAIHMLIVGFSGSLRRAASEWRCIGRRVSALLPGSR